MNSFGTLDKLVINEIEYDFHNLRKLDTQFPKISKLPKSKKVLIENLLRLEDGLNILLRFSVSFQWCFFSKLLNIIFAT